MTSANFQLVDSLENALRGFIGCDAEVSLASPYNLSEATHEHAPAAISWNQSPDITQRLARLGYLHAHRFAVLPSRRNPRWLLPLKDGRVWTNSFQIYVPFARTARMLKSVMVLMARYGWQGLIPHSLLVASKESLPLENLVRDVMGERHPVFALSLGMPETVRKLTLQVMRPNGEIIGYMKVPLTQAAGERVRHEASVLERLNSVMTLRAHVPRLLYSGFCGHRYVLFESLLRGSPGPTSFTKIHSEFLGILQTCQAVEKPGHSVIETVAAKWEKVVSRLGPKWQSLGREAMGRASRELSGRNVQCGIMHGDFTPWHTRVHEENLALFDWESASWDAPVSWDGFHFVAQTECLLKKKNENANLDRYADDRPAYLLYLLHSTAQLVEEESGSFGIDYRERQIIRQLARPAGLN
jgi:hypothetical protein